MIVPEPKGAFYLFPDFSPFKEKLQARGITTNQELYRRLLGDTGVAILPGTAFGRDPEELTARLAYVDFNGAQALAAAKEISPNKARNGELLRTCCSNLLTAIDRLSEWLHETK